MACHITKLNRAFLPDVDNRLPRRPPGQPTDHAVASYPRSLR
jgi:hypothetical protein